MVLRCGWEHMGGCEKRVFSTHRLREMLKGVLCGRRSICVCVCARARFEALQRSFASEKLVPYHGVQFTPVTGSHHRPPSFLFRQFENPCAHPRALAT